MIEKECARGFDLGLVRQGRIQETWSCQEFHHNKLTKITKINQS